MTFLALLLLSIVPVEFVTHDKFDVCELNYYYDDKGELVFAQVLFMDWNRVTCRHEIQAWRLAKDGTTIGAKRTTFTDCGDYYIVNYDQLVVSHTQYDRELVARDLYPKELRRDIRKPLNQRSEKGN